MYMKPFEKQKRKQNITVSILSMDFWEDIY